MTDRQRDKESDSEGERVRAGGGGAKRNATREKWEESERSARERT